MDLTALVQRINDKLAGESFSFAELKTHMDGVMDDINEKLSAKFPVFSDFNANDFPQYPNYNLIPDKYLRSVVVIGTAFKFFTVDEEGADVATKFEQEYTKALFNMQRDYSNLVPLEYQDYDQGYLIAPEDDPTNTPYGITFGGF